ncbi:MULTISPECIES: CoA ester lyase [unclassified Rhizobium]|uniref:HpcH/HpaI aldolase/citrate lyase family protein n=1 Tax=unclassified Rhizobium TaxID=2613769 RepID=UPI00247900B0|nr:MULTISPECIES: CoA ester lyase [unclassified Rhizobium]MDH7804588.1 citrate lyase subunit beta/citryl-CoA lyase [Rhizobium sp. AN70]
MVDFLPPVAPLFVPASRPDRFHKADQSGADAIILDLEDAVAPADKERARDAVISHIADLKSSVIVRINAPGTPWHEGDLDALARLKNLAIMLPKAERPEEIMNAVLRINRNVPVIALIETAVGLARLPDLMSAENVVMVAFGSVDFSLDLGCAHERLALLNARSEIVWRSRAARRAAPLDGVTTDLSNPEITKDDARHAAALGFGGKLAIHPKQVEQIRQAYRPDEQTVAWARNIVAQTASGEAIQVNGEMVDRPVIERARLILSRATNDN